MEGESAIAKFSLWARAHPLEAEKLSSEQDVLIGAALHFLEYVKHNRLLVRLVVYFLAHSGVRFTARCIGKVVGRSSRAVKATKTASVAEIVASAHHDGGRHGGPTLEPVHAGPIAEFVFEHPGCTLDEIAAFAGESLGVVVGINGVRAFLRRHGLVDLKKKEPAAPFF